MIFQQRTNSTMSIAQLIEPALMSFYIKSDAELAGMNDIHTGGRQRVSDPSAKSRPSIPVITDEKGGHKLIGTENESEAASCASRTGSDLEVAA